nr:formin-like protein 5 [Aegilops tauschii subsp. strangulata]
MAASASPAVGAPAASSRPAGECSLGCARTRLPAPTPPLLPTRAPLSLSPDPIRIGLERHRSKRLRCLAGRHRRTASPPACFLSAESSPASSSPAVSGSPPPLHPRDALGGARPSRDLHGRRPDPERPTPLPTTTPSPEHHHRHSDSPDPVITAVLPHLLLGSSPLRPRLHLAGTPPRPPPRARCMYPTFVVSRHLPPPPSPPLYVCAPSVMALPAGSRCPVRRPPLPLPVTRLQPLSPVAPPLCASPAPRPPTAGHPTSTIRSRHPLVSARRGPGWPRRLPPPSVPRRPRPALRRVLARVRPHPPARMPVKAPCAYDQWARP